MIPVLTLMAYGEVKFKDVPANHWAAKSVYNLVKLGITQGYPDGTFRGTKNITRYETAIFLSKLADKLGAGEVGSIQSDLKAIKTEIASLKKGAVGAPISGSFEMRNAVTNLIANSGITGRGPIVNYRLKTALNKEIAENASLKVELDTMDAGFYGTTRDLAQEMLAVEGNLKLNPADMGVVGDLLNAPVEVAVSSGPRFIQHTDATGLTPSENGLVYLRPDTGFNVGTKLWGADVSGGYIVGGYDAAVSGKVETDILTAKLGYTLSLPMLKVLRVEGAADLYTKNPGSSGPKDTRGTLSFSSEIAPGVAASALWGLRSRDTKGWMVGAQLDLANVWKTGINLTLRGSKVGAEFINPNLAVEELIVAGQDFFMRPLENATVNVGGEMSQSVFDKVTLKGKADIRLSSDFGYGKDKPKSRMTGQVGLSYGVAADTSIDAFYRVEQDPALSDTTDLTALGFIYKF